MAHILAIDLGTSSVKTAIFDTDKARIIAIASREYPILAPRIGYAEQRPADWWQAAIEATHTACQQVEDTRISAIGLTGQMHGTVLLDAQHQPLHDAIIWADQRGSDHLSHLIERVGATNFVQIAGTLPATGFMASTLDWFAQEAPALLEQTAHAILPKDFIRLQMTGTIGTDISDAASTALLDIRTGRWSDVIMNALQLPAIMPNIQASADVAGTLSSHAAELLGLPAGIPVIAGCADQPAQALANGLITTGRASVTIGSGGQIFVPQSAPLHTDARLHLFNHAVPDMWYSLGATLSAGLSLRWLRDLLNLQNEKDAYARLSAEASIVPAGAGGVIFLPYLNGERTPHMDAQASGVFIGLRATTDRGTMARAVMEGVAYSLYQVLNLCLSDNTVDEIVISGGAVESNVWRSILVDTLGVPVRKSQQSEQTCTGAAMLASIASGAYDSFGEASAQITQLGEPIEPDQARHTRYMANFKIYETLYQPLKEALHQTYLQALADDHNLSSEIQ